MGGNKKKKLLKFKNTVTNRTDDNAYEVGTKSSPVNNYLHTLMVWIKSEILICRRLFIIKMVSRGK